MAAIDDVNSKIIGAVSGVGSGTILNILGWILFVIIACGIGYYYFFIYRRDKKLFNKRITAFVDNGLTWNAQIRDTAKTVKLGTGGFEILYLKSLKIWRIAYGGYSQSDYYFYVMPDGYWYNSAMKSGVNWIDKMGGLIPIVTTNPLMRGQYTSLEKQIDSLTQKKGNWWEKYGGWVLAIAFVLIAGVLLWLMFKEFTNAMGQLNNYNANMNILLDKVNQLLSNVQGIGVGGNGLKPAV